MDRAAASGKPVAGKAIEIQDDAQFQRDVLQSRLPVLVDFWAPWCGPCRMIAPHVEKLADRWDGRVKVAKVNCDKNSGIQRRYNVMSIPTLMIFKQGKQVESIVGAHGIAAIDKMIATHAPTDAVPETQEPAMSGDQASPTNGQPVPGYYDRFITRRRPR